MWATWANLGPRQGQTCAQLGPTSANNNNTTTTTTTPARADGSAFAGARLSGVSLINNFELRHGGFIPLCPWQIFVRGCFCWALPLLLFALLLCWMAKRISGWGICVSPFVWLFLCFLFGFDLPCYMTTGVNVDFISNCFFTCKDRALERDRPYQRKKKIVRTVALSQLLYLDICVKQSVLLCLPACLGV